MPEEGAVAAIVLDHEQPNQESGGRHGEQQGYPPEAKVICCPGQCPQRHKRHERDGNLDDTAEVTGLAVAREELRQSPRVFAADGPAAIRRLSKIRSMLWGCGGRHSNFHDRPRLSAEPSN